VLSDLGTFTGLPAYAADGQRASTPIAHAPLPGASGADRLLLSDDSPAGTLHFALITKGSLNTITAQRTAVQTELAAWAAAAGFPSDS
jgi:hypothetical protein